MKSKSWAEILKDLNTDNSLHTLILLSSYPQDVSTKMMKFFPPNSIEWIYTILPDELLVWFIPLMAELVVEYDDSNIKTARQELLSQALPKDKKNKEVSQ